VLFRRAVIAQAGPAVVGCYALYKELSADRFAALAGALMMALSPFFITYSGRVMSEIPAFLLLAWGLWWLLRSLRLGRLNSFLAAAFVIGLSANIREFAIFYLPVIPLAARFHRVSWSRSLAALGIAVLAATSGMLIWLLIGSDEYLQSVVDWYRLSAQERAVHGVNRLNSVAYQCSVAATLLAPFALAWLIFRPRLRVLLIVGLCGVLADLALVANHDLAVNPRYLLTGLLGLAAAAGWGVTEMVRRDRMTGAGALVIIAFLTVGLYIRLGKENYDQEWNASAARRYLATVEKLPPDAVFIVGRYTPLINFYQGLGARPTWETISPGAGWPDEQLDEVIDQHLAEGRAVYVDFDESLWLLGKRVVSRERVGLEMIRTSYQLAPVEGTLFRVLRRNDG
jgi:4-amino-4-deoxy-L-arabinose transferase-like glycosyltransferase